MERTYAYRLLKGSWGIAIDITAKAVSCADPEGTPMTPTVWLSVEDPALTRAEEQYLVLGLQRVAASIRKTRVGERPVLIRVLRTWTNYVDYQAEGHACAIIGWAAAEFGFEPPAIPVEFVQDKNRYQFIFDIPEA